MIKKVFLSVLLVMLLGQSVLAGPSFGQELGYEGKRVGALSMADVSSRDVLSLNKKSLFLVVGDSFQLKLLHGDASTRVSWTSGNKSVATVKNGLVRGLKAGKTTITAKIKKTGAKLKCKVTVFKNTKEKIYNEMKSLLKGTWERASSGYSSRYYTFSKSYIKTYDKATRNLLGKGSITALTKEVVSGQTRYNVFIENNVKLVFPLEGGRLKQAWYYGYRNGSWYYSASSSFVHVSYT